jgi:hypothetical protein
VFFLTQFAADKIEVLCSFGFSLELKAKSPARRRSFY